MTIPTSGTIVPTPPAPSVEEAFTDAKANYADGSDNTPELRRLIAAVRAEERAKIVAVLQNVVAVGPHAVGAYGEHAVEEMRLLASVTATVKRSTLAAVRRAMENVPSHSYRGITGTFLMTRDSVYAAIAAMEDGK